MIKNGPHFGALSPHRFQHLEDLFFSCICFGILSHRHLFTRSLSSSSNVHGISHRHSSFVLISHRTSTRNRKCSIAVLLSAFLCYPSTTIVRFPYFSMETREPLYHLIYVLNPSHFTTFVTLSLCLLFIYLTQGNKNTASFYYENFFHFPF